MDAHEKHQHIAVTLFRCFRGVLHCTCEAPCAAAHMAFAHSFQQTSHAPTHPASIQYYEASAVHPDESEIEFGGSE